MLAITTLLLEFLNPGDYVFYSAPVYGGTDHFINHILCRFGIKPVGFRAGCSKEDILVRISKENAEGKVGIIIAETLANPTNALVDIAVLREIAYEMSTADKPVYVAVDNTYMGPLWSHPLKLGADFALYSATKYINDSIAHQGPCWHLR